MKIIDKYIFKEFMTPFSYCFFSFVLIFIIGDLFESLDNFIMQKIPLILVFKYYLFLIPSVFVLTTPLAVLLSILYQLGYMSRHNEIIALKASGISFWRAVIPFCMIGIIFSILLFIVSEKLVPNSSKGLDQIKDLYIKKKTIEGPNNDKSINQKITFFSNLHNMSLYIDRILLDKNTAEDVSIREFYKDGSLKREWYGKKAIWIESHWWFFNGYIRNYPLPGLTNGGMYFFRKQEVPVNIPPEDLLSSQKDIGTISNYMSIRDLYSYMKRNFIPNTLPKELLVDLYKKLSVPITMIVVTMFGITFGGKISKGGALASVGSSLAFYLAYYGISSFLMAMGKLGRIFPSLSIWTPHILFGIISIYLLRRNK